MKYLNFTNHNLIFTTYNFSVNPSLPNNSSISQIEASSLESSVETTALADLPGMIINIQTNFISYDIFIIFH